MPLQGPRSHRLTVDIKATVSIVGNLEEHLVSRCRAAPSKRDSTAFSSVAAAKKTWKPAHSLLTKHRNSSGFCHKKVPDSNSSSAIYQLCNLR